jgi:uncharacterized repeat protein (TIGR03803 family)
MKFKRHWLFALILIGSMVLVGSGAEAPQAPNILYSFSAQGSTNLDGVRPSEILSISNTLYGFTWLGGEFGYGVLFSMNTNGSNYKVLRPYSVPVARNPTQTTPLINSGNVFYGVDPFSGQAEAGSIHSVNLDGSNFRSIHEFTNIDEGFHPQCELALAGDTLFGTTEGGGNGNGTIFAVKTNGQGFRVLYAFSGSSSNTVTNLDGAQPRIGLTLQDNALYGATQSGGNGYGTIFSVKPDGTGFKVLHTFAPAQVGAQFVNADGGWTSGKLQFFKGRLYGSTRFGGSSGNGVLYTLNTNGSDFKLLHTFPGTPNPAGGDPGGLTLFGQKIYGARPDGGTNRHGFIFEYDIIYATYKILYNFTIPDSQLKNADGIRPISRVAVIEDRLYFTASAGGPSGSGTIGSLQLEVARPSIRISRTSQGIRLLLFGDISRTYTLERSEAVPASIWTQQSITLQANPQVIDFAAPPGPTFWRALYR